MRMVALLVVAFSVVVAQSRREEDPIIDQTAVHVIGVGPEVVIDCSKSFDCELALYDPVCGSDGITYDNDCCFAAVVCAGTKEAQTLFIEATGSCQSSLGNKNDAGAESLEPSETTRVDVLYDISTPAITETNDGEVDLTMVFCAITCKLTPDPVCGTDDVTYINDCHLLSSKCEHPELEKASHGACKENPEANTGFQTLAIDEDTDMGDPREASTPAPEKCNPMCERVYDPICGSDGITYANKCLLEYAACRNPSVRAFGEGKCPPHMQAIRGVSNPSSNNNNNGEDACIPRPCPYTYAPVCGSDGQTHDNLCLFANARCEHPQHTLTVVHDGECNADTELTCETMTCPTFSECREQKEADDLVISYCADVCSPDRCSEREDCELVDSDCYTAPCSPIAMCIPKVQDD